ncbi:PREDICTED: uncharacterized protein LOC109588619 [Amphimedon queenslandica]|uniref:Transmembrane protein n=1 Tax=Amphimedon queenslandica TaxID=400682 RepID=A0AAN0JTF6_AMPQE|nr:PREDICTED: uncharacterized protein LOC109588619 [Amphimedon queenslandica]|eukprot:XP_019860326.1 PREDICTED: uncharacterized protein LOC109588619 [Amphimedon queenslandica]
MAHRSYHSWSYESRDNRTGSIQESEQKRPRKRLSKNVPCCLFILFILLAFSTSASLLTFSAFPEFKTKSKQVDLGDISEGLNSFEVIAIDNNVSTVELTLIPPPHDDVQVNILTSSTLPPLSFTTLKENLQISPLTKGHFRTGCNILSFDQPIYLQRGSSLKYNITSSNHEVINQLCYFSNTSDYITFLVDYTFKYVSKFCFNVSGNAIIDITINDASPYYVAIDIGDNTNISLDITAIRFYYNTTMLQDLSSQCSLNESFNFSCIIKICDGYLCDPTKNRYVIVETSHHNIVLKYDAHSTFYFKPTVRLILFSCAVFLELIAVAIALTMVYKLCKKRGPQTEPKCTCKGKATSTRFIVSHFIGQA